MHTYRYYIIHAIKWSYDINHLFEDLKKYTNCLCQMCEFSIYT